MKIASPNHSAAAINVCMRVQNPLGMYCVIVDEANKVAFGKILPNVELAEGSTLAKSMPSVIMLAVDDAVNALMVPATP